jgi:hypothetical protein
VFALYGGLILAVGGVSLFSLGIAFNHLVALFHRRPIHQTNLLTTLLGPSPERHFGWLGLSVATCGVMFGAGSLYLGLHGWAITRLWFWLLGSALFVLVGVQLILFWTLIQVLDALDEREAVVGAELTGTERVAAPIQVPIMSGSQVN